MDAVAGPFGGTVAGSLREPPEKWSSRTAASRGGGAERTAAVTPEGALAELQSRLDAAGFDAAAPRLAVLWPVFRDWAAVPVEGMDPANDADLLLFESALSLHAPSEHLPAPGFDLSLTRQFSYEDERGDYAGMSQLSADFHFAVDDDFHAVSRAADWSDDYRPADQLWGAGGPHAAEWAAAVEATASFQAALRHEPLGVRVFHTPV